MSRGVNIHPSPGGQYSRVADTRLQKNVLDRRSRTTREQLRIAMVTWIERTYHRRRRTARLGRLTPIVSEANVINTCSRGVATTRHLSVQQSPR